MQTTAPERVPGPVPRRRRWPYFTVPLAALLITAFLVFRPDKLVVDDRVDENLADAFPSTSEVATTLEADAVTASTAPAEPAATAVPASTATSTAPVPTEAPPLPEAPALTLAGQFESLAHAGTGTVGVYAHGGELVLRFEDDTAVENGPDLNVYLVPTESWTGSVDGFIDLGDLKGNIGGQNYTVPAGTDLATYRTVVVWCVRFSVGFAAAALTPPA